MNNFLNKRCLFVFSDPGGAKAILALVKQLEQSGLDHYNIISDRAYDFFEDFGLHIEKINAETSLNLFISDHKPDCIITATSYTSQIELNAIAIGTRSGIKTYSFIDHWTGFKKRFSINNEQIYPDEIWVIDSTANDIAIEEGLPASKLRVVGNPYYEFLKNWKPLISKSELLKKIGVSLNSHSDSKIVLLVPEPLSNVGGIEKYGIDEYSFINMVSDSLKKHNNLVVLVKPHPNQDFNRLKETLNQHMTNPNIQLHIIKEVNMNSLLFYSDVVMGMFSNALIEASIFKKMIVRNLIGLKVKDPLAELNVGEVAFSVSQLDFLINRALK